MDLVGSVYDFKSILHYGNKAFSKNGKPTMLSIKEPDLQFGSSAKLSKTDILQLNRLYDCSSKYIQWLRNSNYTHNRHQTDDAEALRIVLAHTVLSAIAVGRASPVRSVFLAMLLGVLVSSQETPSRVGDLI